MNISHNLADSLLPLVIQGTADAPSKNLTEEELKKTLEFCAQAYIPSESQSAETAGKIRLVQFLNTSETIDAIAVTNLHGRCLRLERGNLGLQVTEE